MDKTMNQLRAVTGKPVRAALAVLTVLSLILIPDLGPASGVQAQDPDIAASAITQNVSAGVSIAHYPGFTGTKTFNYTRNVKPSVTVKVNCWGAFNINVSVNLSGNVPLNIAYVPGGRQQSKNMAMSGSKVETISPGFCVSGATYIVQPTVPVAGSVQLTTQGSEMGAAITGNGTVSGPATVSVSGNARMVVYAYLPTIAKEENPVVFSDDFSSDKGWRNFKCGERDPEDCACSMEIGNGRMRVRLDDPHKRCFLAPPEGVKLSQGTFTVRARRRNDNTTWYALIFNASTSLLRQRWALEVLPFGGNRGCSSNRGLVWLSYITDGPGSGELWGLCTDSVNRDKDDWNTLTVVRSGDNIKVAINGDYKGDLEKNKSILRDEEYVNLEVISEDQVPVVVDFDDFEMRR
jgi:hypothetical protein